MVLLSTSAWAVGVKVKWSRYRPGVAQRVGRGIALLLHDRGTRRGWVVSSTPRPHFTPGKDPVPTVQEAGWAPGPVWTGGKSRSHRDSIPDRPAYSQSLYRLSYPAHRRWEYHVRTEHDKFLPPTLFFSHSLCCSAFNNMQLELCINHLRPSGYFMYHKVWDSGILRSAYRVCMSLLRSPSRQQLKNYIYFHTQC